MKKIFVAAMAALAMTAGAASAENISGAGATFPASLYAKWAEGYKQATHNSLNYQAIGSGGGIKQIKARTVDFGATDMPLTMEQQEAAGLYMFPTVVGGVTPIINVAGIDSGKLKLTGEVLAKIFLGDITVWNDPEITKLNPGLHLPATAITVVHRSDASGTTFNFVSYLSRKSADWKNKVGASDTVEWPTGLGGKGNDGVTAFVKQTAGSIGYVEFSYAIKNGVSYALVQNKAGQYPKASLESFGAAAANGDWSHAPGNYLLLLDQPGATSWPITSATFILVYKNQSNAAKARSVLEFFDYGYSAKGDFLAKDLVFVPLSASTKAMIRQQWTQNVRSGGQPVYVSK